MTSAGGLVAIADAQSAPAALLLSGPAGGVRAAAAVAAACGHPDAVTFDMGGTSTDVCLVRGGVPEPAAQRDVGGLPDPAARARHPHDRGRGRFDRAPRPRAARSSSVRESAGAMPGPAAYGRGGTAATVTDADLVLGRIDDRADVPGVWGSSTSGAARDALERAGVDAAGVVAVVDAAMEQAVRAVTVERGVDPRGLALVAFGGAGPLHACAIADALGMPAVIVPPRAGVGSAVGLLASPRRQEVVRSFGAQSLAERPRRGRRASRAIASVPMPSSRPRSTAATSARATRSRSRRPTTSRASTNGATVTRARARRSRWWRCERARTAAAPLDVADLPAVDARGRARSGSRRGTRLHRVDPGRLGGGTPRPRRLGPHPHLVPNLREFAPRGWAKSRKYGCDGRGRAAGVDLAPHGGRRGDGRGAAPRRVQPEHQGASRLLRRAVHTPTARCSCRPSTSRCTSDRCRRRCAPRSTRGAPGSRPVTR